MKECSLESIIPSWIKKLNQLKVNGSDNNHYSHLEELTKKIISKGDLKEQIVDSFVLKEVKLHWLSKEYIELDRKGEFGEEQEYRVKEKVRWIKERLEESGFYHTYN